MRPVTTTEEQRAAVIRLRSRGGMSHATIARHTGVSKAQVGRILREAGITGEEREAQEFGTVLRCACGAPKDADGPCDICDGGAPGTITGPQVAALLEKWRRARRPAVSVPSSLGDFGAMPSWSR